MQVIQKVAPTATILSLADVKDAMHIVHTDEDTLIQAYIDLAIEQAELYTNRQLAPATYELLNDELLTDFRLPKNPIQSITSVEYMDDTGVYQVFSADEYYLYEDAGVGYIHFDTLPSYMDHKQAIKITFVSGYENVPESIINWMRIKVSTMYENRESLVIGVSVSDIGNNLVDKLLESYRIKPL